MLEGDKVELRIGVKEKDWDSSKNWEICTWTRMRDGANCTFTYTKPRYSPTYNVYQLCHGMKEDPRFHGSPELYEGIKNPATYNMILWFPGPMGQMTHQEASDFPSIFSHHFL